MSEYSTTPITSYELAKTEAACHVNKRKTDWWTSMQTKRETCARLDKRYNNYRKDNVTTDSQASGAPRANIGVPLAGQTVDTAFSRIYDNLLGRKPYGRVTGSESSDDLKAQIHQKILDYQQARPGFTIQMGRVIRDALKYGAGFGKLHFKKQVRLLPEPVTFLGIKFGMRKVPKVVMESPEIEHVHIQDIFFPMDATSLNAAEGIIHRTWTNYAALKRATDGLGNPLYDQEALELVKQYTPPSKINTEATIKKERTTRGIVEGGLDKDGNCGVLEYTGRLPENVAQAVALAFNADPMDDFIVTVVEGVDIPIRLEPSPYLTSERMFVCAKIIDDPGYIWGISLIESVEALGITIEELYNMVMDNLNFVINKMFYVNTLAGIDEADIVASPGKVIRGTRPPGDAFQVIEWPDIAQSVFLLIQNFLGHYKEYTGIQNPVLASASSGSQTATEFSGLVASSQTRLGQFDRSLEETLMRPVFDRYVILNQQFLSDEFLQRIFKDSGFVVPRVAPEDMQGIFDYYFDGANRVESQALYTGQLMQALQVNATQPVPIFNPLYIGGKMAENWGWKNVAEALNPAYAAQYMMFQRLQMMQMLGETAKALTPEQQAKSKTSNPAAQGAAAQPANVGIKDFRSTLATVKEAALPQGISEGQV